MWAEYWNWLWPFFGPFRGDTIENFFQDGLIRELANPSEWLFGLALLLILISLPRIELLCRSGKRSGGTGTTGALRRWQADHPWIRDHPLLFRAFAGICVSLLALAGVFAIFCGAAGVACPVTGFDDLADNLLMGIILLGGALVLGWIDLRKDTGEG